MAKEKYFTIVGRMAEEKYFTVVFKGDIKDLDFNPLKCWTPYGEPVACCDYDAFSEIDKMQESVDGDYK